MKSRDFWERSGLSSPEAQVGLLAGEFALRRPSWLPGWCLCFTVNIRAISEHLSVDHGDERAAPDNVYNLFPLTCEILRRRGSGRWDLAKHGILALNQIVWPFSARCHRLLLAGAVQEPARCAEFRTEQAALQHRQRDYSKALADLA